MGRPAKIHKKKSFMFTTRHHTFTGIMSATIGIATVAIVIAMIVDSYSQAGDVPINLGGVGLCSSLLNIIGVIYGYLGLNERDAHRTPPIIGIVINVIMLIVWIGMIIVSYFKG